MIDTLPQFAGIHGDGKNSSGAALEAPEPIQTTAALGIGVILSRHERKSGGDVGDSGRGSSAWGGVTDIIISIRRGDGNSSPTVRVPHSLSRFDETPDKLVIDLRDGEYIAVGTETQVAQQYAREAILDAAPDSEDEAKKTSDLIKDAPGVKRTIGQDAIAELFHEGSLIQTGSGKRNDAYRYWKADLNRESPVEPYSEQAEFIRPYIRDEVAAELNKEAMYSDAEASQGLSEGLGLETKKVSAASPTLYTAETFSDENTENSDPQGVSVFTKTQKFLNNFQYVTDPEQARDIVASLKTEAIVGLDIETAGLDPILDRIRTVQLSTGEETYVFDAKQVTVQDLIPVLSGGPVKVAHNAHFDAGFLWDSPAAVMPEPLFDTMLADQVIHNRSYGRSLKDLAKEYLDIELDKDQQRSDWSGNLSSDQIAYAANDSAILLPLYEVLTKEVDVLGMTKVVELENAAIPPVVWMERSGVCFDQEKWTGLGDIAKEKAEERRVQLDAIAVESLGAQATPINWNSTPQVLTALKALGLPVENTQQETPARFKEEHRIIPALLAYRESTKRVGTYGPKWAEHVHKATDQIHPDWRQLGA